MNSNVTAAWRAHKRGALFANPCFTQIHPTCIPVSGDHQSKLTLMSESLRNDGRVWVPKAQGDKRPPAQIPEAERDYYLERKYPSFGNLVPRDVASRNAKAVCDEGRGVGDTGLSVYLDFADAITAARHRHHPRALRQPVRHVPAHHRRGSVQGADAHLPRHPLHDGRPVGGLQPDEQRCPACTCSARRTSRDHGANRLGASALMQGLADGYFVIPYTIGHYLASTSLEPRHARATTRSTSRVDRRRRPARPLLAVKGKRIDPRLPPRRRRRPLGRCGDVADRCGPDRTPSSEIRTLRDEFWQDVSVPGEKTNMNQALDYAGRVADYLEFGELLALDALHRTESCGGHFREESQTPEGEALRDDEHFSYVAAWEFGGVGQPPTLHQEPLVWENVNPSQRSYK